MVQNLERVRSQLTHPVPASLPQKASVQDFPESAPAANPVFYRTYSRRDHQQRETWEEVCQRTVNGLAKLGQLSEAEQTLLLEMQRQLLALPSGRWMWIGGTPWMDRPENFSGAYNCTSTNTVDWRSFGLMMDLAMMGCGTGAILEPFYVSQLPPIRNTITIQLGGQIGTVPAGERQEQTSIQVDGSSVEIWVGDSRQGWVHSYQSLLELSTDHRFDGQVRVTVHLSHVRPAGESLKGFGGVANPIRLPGLYDRCATILNRAVGRQLSSVEACLLIDEAAVTIVAGNIRRSAGMRQGASDDEAFANAKANLWQQDRDGNWRIDPERDALRMANHTRVFHSKPSESECLEAVRKQFYSGEGAIQYAPEAIARANADILSHPQLKQEFLEVYTNLGRDEASGWLSHFHPEFSAEELEHRLQRYGLNPCGEILGANFHCNLAEVHLNQINATDFETQDQAFTAGALSVAALLNHRFGEPRYQRSRELDPIVGVSFTGLFDFFVQALGVKWLWWWDAGRPDNSEGVYFKQQEQFFLRRWRDVVHQQVWQYCDRHGLKRPNRCTTVQPAGTKSLLTGASPGWHPPKAQRFIRRITFRKADPVALACLDFGYRIVPSQSDKDETGQLLDDPFDPRCTEWLVEIPVEVPWANMAGADEIDISRFSALAQFDFYMQVQKYYTTHNTSATIEFREAEVDGLGRRIFEAIHHDEGYISVAMLARFDDHQTFPRLPFEPIDRQTYEVELLAVNQRRRVNSFHEALSRYDSGLMDEVGPAGCDSDKCMLPEQKP